MKSSGDTATEEREEGDGGVTRLDRFCHPSETVPVPDAPPFSDTM